MDNLQSFPSCDALLVQCLCHIALLITATLSSVATKYNKSCLEMYLQSRYSFQVKKSNIQTSVDSRYTFLISYYVSNINYKLLQKKLKLDPGKSLSPLYAHLLATCSTEQCLWKNKKDVRVQHLITQNKTCPYLR